MTPALESALLIQLRDTINWESSLATADASGTLTPIDPNAALDASRYQRRDRELAFRDTVNAAAIMDVSVQVSDVWNSIPLRPRMQGPQRTALPYNAQDTGQVSGKVFHVENVSLPLDAFRYTDQDLYGRDLLIYETLARAAQVFTDPPIQRLDSTGTVIPDVSAWSLGAGTVARSDINPALPLNRDLFKLPDQNLADRDNQMAGYVAQLVQVLRNPFEHANRLYVRVTVSDIREVEIYSLITEYFVAGNTYEAGDQVSYLGAYYQATATTTELPTNVLFWAPISAPTHRVWVAEPSLPGRNRIIYDTDAKTLQWFRETNDMVHIPQLFAMSIPGIFSDQRIETIAQVPVRQDSQHWRQKAARLLMPGDKTDDLDLILNTASFEVSGALMQFGGASLTIPGKAVFHFDVPGGNIDPGSYRIALLVRPDSLVEIPGSENTQGVSGTLGGADFGAIGTGLTWQVGLPNTQWEFSLDYTNLTGTSNGFQVQADLSGFPILDDTVPLYFNDQDGNPLPNGQIATSTPAVVLPSGQPQNLNIRWTGSAGDFNVQVLRFQTEAFTDGRYKMSGTLAGQVSNVDVTGHDKNADVMLFDFTTLQAGAPDFSLAFIQDGQLPLRFLQAQLLSRGTNTPTPYAQGFEGFRQDCLERAVRSCQDSFQAAVNAYGTDLGEFATGSVWDKAATEQWMATIEVYEPRLREVANVPFDGVVTDRQYKVITGTVAYETGTYVPGQAFVGASGTEYLVVAGSGTVTQMGAFLRSKPGYLGKPALVPAGLEYNTSNGTITSHYAPAQTGPTLAALQPWMIEAGIYAAQPDFWSPPSQ